MYIHTIKIKKKGDYGGRGIKGQALQVLQMKTTFSL